MQQWQIDLTKKCGELNLEMVATITGLFIACPKTITKRERDKILNLIPNDLRPSIKFEVSPKPSTMAYVKNFVQSIGLQGAITPEWPSKHLKIDLNNITGMVNVEAIDWNILTEALSRDGFFESWEISCGKNVLSSYNRKISEEIEKNMFREKVIQKDEITDLHILLETETDFDKLLEKL